jgi:hypothetical protein
MLATRYGPQSARSRLDTVQIAPLVLVLTEVDVLVLMLAEDDECEVEPEAEDDGQWWLWW